MLRTAIRIVMFGLGTVAIIFAGATLWLLTLDLNAYKGTITEQLSAAVGRDVVIEGNLGFEPSLIPSISANSIGIANPSWASRPQLVSIARFSGQLELIPLVLGEVRIRDVSLEGVDVLLEKDESGRGNWQLSVTSDSANPADAVDQSWQVKVEKVSVADLKLRYLESRDSRMTVLDIDHLTATLPNPGSQVELVAIGRFNGEKIDLTGRFRPLQALFSSEPVGVDVVVRGFGGDIAVRGRWRRQGDTDVFDAAAKLLGDQLNATAASLRNALPAINIPSLPAIGPYDVSARLRWQDGKLGLSAIDALIGKPATASVHIEGAVGDLVTASGMDLNLKISGEDLSKAASIVYQALPDLPPQDVSAIGSFNAAARLRGSLTRVSLTDIAVTAGKMNRAKVDITGSVDNIVSGTGLKLGVGVAGNELATVLELLRPYLPFFPDAPVPPIGPFKANGVVEGKLEGPSLPSIWVSMGKEERVLVTVRGSISRPLTASGMKLDVALRSRNARDLARYFGWQIARLPPFDFAAQISDRKGGYDFQQLRLQALNQAVTGDASLSFRAKKPEIEARLSSRLIDVPVILSALGASWPKAPEKAAVEKFLIPDAPLPLAIIQAVTGSVDLSMAQLRLGKETRIEGVRARLANRSGKFFVKPFRATIAGGTVDAALELQHDRSPPQLAIKADAQAVELGRLLKHFGYPELLKGGATGLQAELQGQGNTVRHVVAGLDGKVTVEIGKGETDISGVPLVARDFMSELVRLMNPIAERSRSGTLQCAVLYAVAKKGQVIIPNGFALETNDVEVTGSGAVDLVSETLDIGFKTDPKKGLGLGLAQQLAGFLRLKGTLKEPEITVDRAGAAESAVRLGGAVATSGLSLLAEQLIRRTEKVARPCERALKIASGEASVDEETLRSRIFDKPVESIVGGAGKAIEKGAEGTKSILEGVKSTVGGGVKRIGEGIERGLQSIFGGGDERPADKEAPHNGK